MRPPPLCDPNVNPDGLVHFWSHPKGHVTPILNQVYPLTWPFARALYLCAYLEVGPKSKPMLADSSLFFHNWWGNTFCTFFLKKSHTRVSSNHFLKIFLQKLNRLSYSQFAFFFNTLFINFPEITLFFLLTINTHLICISDNFEIPAVIPQLNTHHMVPVLHKFCFPKTIIIIFY
jgi:hypothetical protein